jgi:hypothetical protein
MSARDEIVRRFIVDVRARATRGESIVASDVLLLLDLVPPPRRHSVTQEKLPSVPAQVVAIMQVSHDVGFSAADIIAAGVDARPLAVNQAMSRLHRDGIIRRVSNGVYRWISSADNQEPAE